MVHLGLFYAQASSATNYDNGLDVLMPIAVGITMLALLYLLAKFLSVMFNFSTSHVIGSKKFNHVEFRPKKITEERKNILIKHFPYYQKLPPKSKHIFESRVVRFARLKAFKAKKNLVLTDEMVVFISASAVQLTFGLRDYRFLHFDRIEIYPEKFFSPRGKAYHLGETDARNRVLRFSWVDFVKGYAIGDDNRNLGLHEFSHALFLNYLAGKKEDVHFDQYYDQWKAEGSRQFFGLKKHDSHYIRNYAQTNLMEFFAVCVECFFETPEQLFKLHAPIYLSIKKLLCQDPRALNQQFKVKR